MVDEVKNVKDEYRVIYDRDETGWWTARVPEVRGCHTQGRTVEEARRRIREALSLFVDNAKTATLRDEPQLPANATRAIHNYVALHQRAEADARRALEAGRVAVRLLQSAPLKMSGRDTAGVLGISHQRVHQLTHSRMATNPAHAQRAHGKYGRRHR